MNLPGVRGAAQAEAGDGFTAAGELAAAAGDGAGSEGNTDIPGDLQAGDTVRRPGSARALEAIATGGRDAFYGGEFGDGLLALAVKLGVGYAGLPNPLKRLAALAGGRSDG